MSYSDRCMTDADWRLIRHFKPSEFKYPAKMGYSFMLWLDMIRERAGVAFRVTSSFRAPEYNKSVGGAQDSAHTDDPCDAVDLGLVKTPADPHGNRWRCAVVSTALRYGCRRIGIYPNGSLHLDMTHDKRPADVIWIAVDNPAK